MLRPKLPTLFVSVLFGFMLMGASPVYAAACPGGTALGLPKWYEYLQCTKNTNSDGTTAYTPDLSNINDVWLIGAAVLEILLRLASLFAIVLVIWGGIQYVTSRGEPDKTSKARGTILNALIGLTIAVISASLVAFVAGRFN